MFLTLRILLLVVTGWLVGYTIAKLVISHKGKHFADAMIKNNIEFPNFYIQLISKQIGYMGDSEAVACLSPETLKIAEAHRHMYDVPMRDCITEIIIPRDDLPVDKVILETPWSKFLSLFGK